MNEIVSFKPDHSLSAYISGYIYGIYNYDTIGKQFYTPKGTAALVVPLEINPNSFHAFPDQSSKLYYEEFVPYLFGQSTKMTISHFRKRFKVFVIVFTPTGLFHFIEGPASQMTNKVKGLNNLGFSDLHHNLKNLFETNSEIEKCLVIVNQLFTDHFNKIPRRINSEFIPSVIHKIHSNKGVVNLEKIVEELGIANRTFQIHFKNEIGISPKLFCRITRFNSLLQALDAVPTADILSFAVQFGYADKPHLYKDFKEFIGMTPLKYMKLINNVNSLIEKEVRKHLSK